MESTSRKAKAESFVRQNSLKVAADLPDNEMAQFLAQNQTQEIASGGLEQGGTVKEFTHWLSEENKNSFENEEMETLFKERKELSQTWLKFQTKYPECSELLPNNKGPPTVEALRAMMQTTVRDWENERSKGLSRAKENFLGFSETLVSFSNLFSVIPQGDKYISLFTGVVSTAVKAAARHKEIAEGFSAALDDIGRDMNFSTEELKIHRTPKIERLVIRLYIKHAKFFCHFMTWFSSSFKRFTTSLRTDFYAKEVKLRVAEIRDVAKEIEREALLSIQIHAQRTDRRVHHLPTMNDSVQIAEFYHQKTVQYIDKSLEMLTQKIGHQSKDYTVGYIESQMYDAEVLNAKKLTASGNSISNRPLHLQKVPELGGAHLNIQEASGTKHPGRPKSLPSSHTRTRAGLEQACQNVHKYMLDLNSEDDSSTGSSLASTISGLIVTRLKEWIASPKSDFLWIIGLTSAFGNEACLATQHIKHLATTEKLPCISFSSNLATVVPFNPGERQSRHIVLLVAMLYSFIQQLSLFVPATFEDSYDLEGAITKLDGRKESLQKALEIIRVLLRHRTPLLLVILDGLEQLDDDETTPYLCELFDILHTNEANSRLKVLLGSQGYLLSGVNLEVEERVDCVTLPIKRGGRARPDGRLLSEIDSFTM